MANTDYEFVLFSSFIDDHFKDDNAMMEFYMENNYGLDGTSEEIEDPDELMNKALEFCQSYITDLYDSEKNYVLSQMDKMGFDNFRADMDMGRWNGRSTGIEEFVSIKEFYQILVSGYRGGLENIGCYLDEGRIYFKLAHHDATDNVSITAMFDDQEVEIEIEQLM